MKKIIAWLMCFALVLSFMPAGNVNAATKMSKCKIKLAKTTYTYTKKAIKPKVVVKNKTKTLKNKKNYTVKYKNNKKVGTATVEVTGKGTYNGTVKKKFKIVPKLSATSLSVEEGKTCTLTATSSSKVTFTCSDTSVATVDAAGVITGMKEGTATITATSNKVSNTCKLTVVKGSVTPDPAQVNYTLSDTNKTINVGDNTASISIVNYTGNNATAVSSNESLIHARYIGSGVIELYAHSVGEADVTVTVEGRTLMCHVTAVMSQGGDGGNVRCEMGDGHVYVGYATSVSWNDSSNAQNGLPANIDHSKIKWSADDEDMVIIKPYSKEAKESHNTISDGDIYVDVVKAGDTYIRASYNGVEQAYHLMAYSVTDGEYISVNRNEGNKYSRLEDCTEEDEGLSYGKEAQSVLGSAGLEKTVSGSEEDYGGFNHVSGMAYYKKGDTVYYALCDVWNSRVLIYKGNSIKDATSKGPVTVLGQKDYTSSVPGYTLDKMNYPMDCAVDPDKGTLIVTDSHNDRLLVFDNIAVIADKGEKGIEAKYVINWFAGEHKSNSTHIVNPWGVNIEKVDGKTKMIVGNLGRNNLLIWNELPETWEEFKNSENKEKGIYTENYYPDLVLTVEQGATPRSITWTGKQLIVGDENIQSADGSNRSCYRVFDGFPTVEGMEAKVARYNAENGALEEDEKKFKETTTEYKVASDGTTQTQYTFSQTVAGYIDDFIYADTYGEGAMINNRLYLVCHGGIYIYNDGEIDNADDAGDLRMWNTHENAYIGYNGKQVGYYVCGGGMGQLFYEADKDVLWYGAFNDNQLVGWSKPKELFDKATKASGEFATDVRACPIPDITVGADTYNINSTKASSKIAFMHNPVPESDGKHFVVLDDLDGQLRVYNDIPCSSGALPDYSYEFNHELGDVKLYKDNKGKVTMIVTERTMRLIHIWNDYKFDGAMPDVTIGKRIGSEYLTGEVTNVEYDGTYFYLTTGTHSSESGRLKVLVYKGIPTKESEPVAVITGEDFSATYYGQVSSNGNYVIVNPNGTKVLVYRTSQFEGGKTTRILSSSRNGDASGPENVIDTVNVGEEINETNDPDNEKYGIDYSGSNKNQHFNLYPYEYYDSSVGGNVTKTMYERTTITSMYDMLITPDNMLVITNMGDNRVVIWNDIDDAIEGNSVTTIIGHSEKSYDTNDLYGIYDYHAPVGTLYNNTLYMPNKLCFDGKNLWVGEYKWSNRLLRFRVK
jgi:hypothetical protein